MLGSALYLCLTVSESCSSRHPTLIHDAADLLVNSRGWTPILLLLSGASEVWMRQMGLVMDVRGQQGVAPMAIVLVLQLGLKARICTSQTSQSHVVSPPIKAKNVAHRFHDKNLYRRQIQQLTACVILLTTDAMAANAAWVTFSTWPATEGGFTIRSKSLSSTNGKNLTSGSSRAL